MVEHPTTTREIAEAFGVSVPTVCRLAHEPDCPAIRVGGVWRWPPLDQVRTWLQIRTDALRGGSKTAVDNRNNG